MVVGNVTDLTKTAAKITVTVTCNTRVKKREFGNKWTSYRKEKKDCDEKYLLKQRNKDHRDRVSCVSHTTKLVKFCVFRICSLLLIY